MTDLLDRTMVVDAPPRPEPVPGDPDPEDGSGFLSVMGKEGDTKVTWDRTRPIEVAEARKTFDRLIKKGYMAVAVSTRGGTRARDTQIKEFDPNAEEVLMVPAVAGGSVDTEVVAAPALPLIHINAPGRRAGPVGLRLGTPGLPPLHIDVSDADVLSGRRSDGWNCPVNMAASRALAASPHAAEYGDLTFPPEAEAWITAFDAGVEVGAISFDATPVDK